MLREKKKDRKKEVFLTASATDIFLSEDNLLRQHQNEKEPLHREGNKSGVTETLMVVFLNLLKILPIRGIN